MKTLNPANANQEKQELVYYLKETIDNICERVRNKMVAPYAALTLGDGENPPPAKLVEAGIKEIQWLCHTYFPEITSSVEKRVSELNQ